MRVASSSATAHRRTGKRIEHGRRVVLAARLRAGNLAVMNQQVGVLTMLAHVVAGAARILVGVPARDERESGNERHGEKLRTAQARGEVLGSGPSRRSGP